MEEKRSGLDTAIMRDNRSSNEMSASNETHQLIGEADIKREPDIKEEPQFVGDLTEILTLNHSDDGPSSVDLTSHLSTEDNSMDSSINEVKSEVKEEPAQNNGNASKPNNSYGNRSADVADDQRNGLPEGDEQRQELNQNDRARNWNMSTKANRQVKAPRLHQCDLCGYSTQYLSYLKRHLLTHTGERPFACDHCDKAFKSKQALRNHLKVHAEEFHFLCAVCLMGFDQINMKIEHEVHCKALRYECHLCNKSSGPKKTNLIKHMLVHSGSTLFECQECSKQFARKASLKRHMKLHGGARSFGCSICRERFAQQNEVIEHELKCNRRVYECYVCGKSIGMNKGHLDQHMRTHTGIKPFKCDQCPLKFAQKGHLNTHIRIHSRSLPWKCLICRQGFSMQTQRNAHQRSCSRRVYECFDCKKFIGRNSINLKSHMTKHSDEKPFRCEICGNRFAWKRSLNQHLNVTHNRKR